MATTKKPAKKKPAKKTGEDTKVLSKEEMPSMTHETKEENKLENQKEIQVIERIIENKEVEPADAFGKFTRSQINLMKRTIAKGSTDDELRMFIQVCKGASLNPFLKQVYLVKRWDSREGREVGTIQVGIDGFRSIAEGSGSYAGNDDPKFGQEKTIKQKNDKQEVTFNAPEYATVTVYKIVQGVRCPFTATARWAEYFPAQFGNGFQWRMRPYLMLGKCAEALALRKAFPKLFSGMYEEAELANAPEKPKKIEIPKDKVFETLSGLIAKATPDQLGNIKKKLEEPGEKNYSEEERQKLLALVDKRLAEAVPSDDKEKTV